MEWLTIFLKKLFALAFVRKLTERFGVPFQWLLLVAVALVIIIMLLSDFIAKRRQKQ
jgi:hypothetical protein